MTNITCIVNIFQDMLTEGIPGKENPNVLMANPVHFLARAMEVLNKEYPWLSGSDKKIALIFAVEAIAKGSDGIEGTADDILPRRFVHTLKLLINNGVVEDIADVVCEASKGQYQLSRLVPDTNETVEPQKVKSTFLSMVRTLLTKCGYKSSR